MGFITGKRQPIAIQERICPGSGCCRAGTGPIVRFAHAAFLPDQVRLLVGYGAIVIVGEGWSRAIPSGNTTDIVEIDHTTEIVRTTVIEVDDDQ